MDTTVIISIIISTIVALAIVALVVVQPIKYLAIWQI